MLSLEKASAIFIIAMALLFHLLDGLVKTPVRGIMLSVSLICECDVAITCRLQLVRFY